MEVAIFWLLLTTMTGFRIIERDLQLSSNQKYHSRRSLGLSSLLVGVAASSMTFAGLALIVALAYALVPSFIQQAPALVSTSLGRWLHMSMGNGDAAAVVVTMGLILSFLIAPAFTFANRRLFKSLAV